MNYDWKNIDLKNACIFDLTDDIEMIHVVICDDIYTLNEKEKYLKETNKIDIACSMHDYAFRINDSKLVNELEKVFKAEYDEFESFFNE